MIKRLGHSQLKPTVLSIPYLRLGYVLRSTLRHTTSMIRRIPSVCAGQSVLLIHLFSLYVNDVGIYLHCDCDY